MSTTKNSRGSRVILILAVMSILPVLVYSAALSSDEQAFFDRHVSDVVQVKPIKLDGPAMLKVFATSFYNVKVVIKLPDGEENNDIVAARIGDKLVSFGRPGSDADLPDFVKMLKPDFKLLADADAKTLQEALDITCPIIGDSDKKAEAFRHTGNQWIFIRGDFFDSKLGYIFQTDASGTVQSVKFTLKLP